MEDCASLISFLPSQHGKAESIHIELTGEIKHIFIINCQQRKGAILASSLPLFLCMLSVTNCLPYFFSSNYTGRNFEVSLQGPIPTQAVSSIQDHELDLLVQEGHTSPLKAI